MQIHSQQEERKTLEMIGDFLNPKAQNPQDILPPVRPYLFQQGHTKFTLLTPSQVVPLSGDKAFKPISQGSRSHSKQHIPEVSFH